MAGIVGAVIVAAAGVMFTAWFNEHGSDAIDRIGGAAAVKVPHVEVHYSSQDLALRETVTDPRDRAVLLGSTDLRHGALLERHHAALVGQMDVTVVLEGNRSSLRVADIKPRVLTRQPVSDGAYLIAVTAGETDTIEMAADLDRLDPYFTTGDKQRTSYFLAKQIDLKQDERVTLSLSITGRKAYYEFDLVATVVTEGRAEQMVIRAPGGVPFRLTGPAADYRSFYIASPNGGWMQASRDVVCAEFPKAKRC
ncbi:hypothetical protein ACWEQG_20825 [Microbispora sp. NPDC004025]